MRIVFVEFESDSGEPPISYFVEATAEQEVEISALVSDTIEEDLRPYIGEIVVQPFEAFMAEFRENWGDPEDEDA